ncbi:MAG TPA: extracellular solute-binding protein [Streptosporangiaceae bacterium]|nr:extracellular solute-binding protein [Streptosporangiaceae bacterium]
MKYSKALLSAAAVGGMLAAVAACSSGSTGSSAAKVSKAPLTLMFGSSGPAETKAVDAAASAFTKQSGIKVKVIAASNLTQQLAQGFAAGHPPDVFYLDPGSFQNYAKDNALYPYAQTLPNAGDFYPALRAAFTYKGTFICDPKDASTLALYINTTDWRQAGLTSADIPKNWSQLAAVSKKLTTHGRVGLVLDQSHSELDEFLYQNGGTVVGSNGKVDLDSSQNVTALAFLKKMLDENILKFPPALSSGWSGQAFGENKAAMDIVGNWMVGAMQADYPKVHYQVATIPSGPTGKTATLSFTNCWGIPRSSANLGGAVKFVKFLTTPQQQMAFSKAFGVIPSLATLQGTWQSTFPNLAVHTKELTYAHPDIALPNDAQALAAFDGSLAQLATSNPATILAKAQDNLAPLASQAR